MIDLAFGPSFGTLRELSMAVDAGTGRSVSVSIGPGARHRVAGAAIIRQDGPVGSPKLEVGLDANPFQLLENVFTTAVVIENLMVTDEAGFSFPFSW